MNNTFWEECIETVKLAIPDYNMSEEELKQWRLEQATKLYNGEKVILRYPINPKDWNIVIRSN